MNRSSKLLITILFLALISFPYLTSLFSSSSFNSLERRTLSPFPTFEWSNRSTWALQISAYFNDHFGFRPLLLEYYERIKVNLIGSTIIYRSVVKDGWVMDAGPSTYKDHYSSIFLSTEKLEKIKVNLEREANYVKSKNIPYLSVLAPRKHSVQPELYPFPNSDTSYLSAKYILNYLSSNTQVEIVDLVEELPKFKDPNLPLFYRTDGHWTNYGAFAGYHVTLTRAQKLNPNFPRLEKDDFEITPEVFNIWQGDNALKALDGRRPTDIGVNMALKSEVNKKFPGTIIAIGDSYMHITRGVPMQTVDHPNFPETRTKLALFFQNPNALPTELLVPKVPLDDLIPLIRNNLTNPDEAERLITYLKSAGVKDDPLEGLGYFLTLNFENVVFVDNLKPLDLKLVDELNPVLVIRATQQNGLPNLVFEKQ